MMIRAMLLAAAAAMPLTACMSTMDGETGMSGRSAMSASAAMDMTPEDRMNYVKMAGASDLFEIQSSQLALSRAQRPETRAYAQMLIQHHNQTTNATMAAARASGMMPPPPMLMPMQQRMMAELQRTSGAGFDRVYLTQQVPAHEMALALHTNYSQAGDTPALRQTAATAVPLVQQHLDEARRMRGMM